MSKPKGHFRNKNKHHNQFSDRKPNAIKEYSNQEQLSEADVGITEFLNDFEGFSAIIKARFSDFQVNEIDMDGNVVKLSDLSIPQDFKTEAATCDYKEIIESPSQYISNETWESMKKLVEAESGDPVLIDADNFDKNIRMEVHTCVKSHFGRKLVASTIQKDGKKYIETKKFDKDKLDDSRNRWPKDKGEYVHFVMYKEILDTMEAILKLSDRMKLPASSISYAGVKDKRAKTTQWCSVRRVEPWKLIKCNGDRKIKIGNLTFKDRPLKLGQLQGNRFRIALRNVLANDDLIEKSMKFIDENGFINYYGLQRFGNDKEVPTYMIGIKLLLGQWKEACDLILKPKEAEDRSSDVFKAKKIYAETRDAKKAFESIPQYKYKLLEGRLLKGLMSSNANDYVTALESVPLYTRLMYMNSFQSLIWNKMVSQRLKLFGLKPVVGDLILVEKVKEETEQVIVDIADENEEEKVCDDEKEEKNENDKNEDEVVPSNEVKELEESDLSQYTIHDIVLPLPGYGIKYPEYLKQYYKEAVEEYGLTLEMTPQKLKKYSTRGNYRHIMKKLTNISWKILMYNDPTDNLIRSDFEELQGLPEPESIELGRYKALVLHFDLPSSSYATMVLRELLKSNTSTSAQAKLNKYHEEKEKLISVEADNEVPEKNDDDTEMVEGSSSLLSNPSKYEEFKNSIFKDILGPTKRKTEEEEEENDSKKLKNA